MKTVEEVVERAPFPPELDLAYYRNSHEDLRSFDNRELLQHFEHYGRIEGRAGTLPAFREHFLKFVATEADTLEIGPFCNPLLRGARVRYFDIADRDTLIQRAAALNCASTDAPVIDYVAPTGDMSIVDRQFDQVLSSHCIEHQPDLVNHFREVSRLLQSGGVYFLIVPDKRFCFDHYRSESTIADVLGAHIEQRRVHYAKSVLGMQLLATHNDPVAHWQGNHGRQIIQERGLAGVNEAIDQLIASANVYIDSHAWQFTPSSFKSLVTSLFELALTNLRVERVYSTPFGRLEFCAILVKS
jgi:SAM-dependent methyltransferase